MSKTVFISHSDTLLHVMDGNHAESPALSTEEYVWITEFIKEIAKENANNRIVSSLEGGYHLPSLAKSAWAHINALEN